MVRKVSRDIIHVDVDFPELLSRSSLLKVVTDLLKNLLHQRNQIPLQYDCITKDVEAAAEVSINNDDIKQDNGSLAENDDNGASSRGSARLSRQAARAAKMRALYLKNSMRLINEMEETMEMIREELEKDDLVSISFLLGATPLSPREIYTIDIPKTSNHLATNFRVGVHLFRAMVINDQLHNLTSSRIPVSNIFILFCRSSSPLTSSLQLLPTYSLPPVTRCPRVTFRLRSLDDMIVPVAPNRRLRFTSGTSRLTPAIPECSPDVLFSDHDKCSPEWRESNEKPKDVESILRTSKKPEMMELCTPLVSRIVPQVLSTPAPTLQEVGSMQLCTPASVNMDFCTPAVSSRIRETDELLSTPIVSDLMDLCTPAVRTQVSDEMELCTPCINKLQLNSDKKVEDFYTLDSKFDEKDSGISSPYCSTEECDEEYFWFVTPKPIRGFK